MTKKKEISVEELGLDGMTLLIKHMEGTDEEYIEKGLKRIKD